MQKFRGFNHTKGLTEIGKENRGRTVKRGKFYLKKIRAGATRSILQPQIPIFNGKNYDYWSIRMKTLFSSQDVWDLVENGFPELSDSKLIRLFHKLRRIC